MTSIIARSTKSLTGKLAFFFTLVSVLCTLLVLFVLYNTMRCSEDEVGKKLILLDADTALAQYRSGKKGKLQINSLTDAYDDLALLPTRYLHYLQKEIPWLNNDSKPDFESNLSWRKSNNELFFLGEIEEGNEFNRMVYVSQFEVNGITKYLLLLSRFDDIELSAAQLSISITIVSVMFAILLATFTLILMRLSKSLISPINNLSKQLKKSKTEPDTAFTMPPEAVVEFTQLTELLNHYREEMNALIKREQMFARYASHELRTPLTIIKGANGLLQIGVHSTFQARQLSRINRATTQMVSIVDALLALVRYESDNSDQPLRTITKKELHGIVQEHQAYLTDKNIEVHFVVSAEPEVKATDVIINMMIANLLRNAISATESGDIEIQMNKQFITVLDEGCGLGEQPFPEGHGLGLMLMNEICRRYGWIFTLKNRKNKGCIAKVDFNDSTL